MICHQAKAVHPIPEALDPLLDKKIKAVSVFVVEEDLLPGVASEYDVVISTGVM